jgi:2-phosphosulfolactate phosphatase
VPAPDIPATPQDVPLRVLHTHLHARFVESETLAGGVVIVIDALRASVTIATALAAGAARIVPTLTVDEARRYAEELRGQSGGTPSRHLCGASDLHNGIPCGGGILLGGERGGDLIPGFDLDNSPCAYTSERVAGRTIIFTTTNGTPALFHSARADLVLVGSLCNLSSVVGVVANDSRPVHLLCAGSREHVGLDDVLVAGAFVDAFLSRGRSLPRDDSGRIALRVWRSTGGNHAEIVRAMRESRGRTDVPPGLARDFDVCARVDSLAVVPRFDAVRRQITIHCEDAINKARA